MECSTTLQEEDGTEIGWLLYSTREIDAGALADEIIDTIGTNIGLRWKVIIAKENMVRVLIVEVSGQQKTRCIAQLLKLYSRKMKLVHEYPNGIRLRFVKNRSAGVNSVEKYKMDKLRKPSDGIFEVHQHKHDRRNSRTRLLTRGR